MRASSAPVIGGGVGGSARDGRGRGVWLAIGVLLVIVSVVAVTGRALENVVPGALAEHLYPVRYTVEIGRAAERYDMDPYLVAAVMKAESGFDARAVSGAGAVGLMQLMPATADWIVARDDWRGDPKPDLTDPADNVELGTYYLAYLLDRFGGDVPTALAAYNAGEGAVARWLVDGADPAGGSVTTLQPAEIPFPETRGFVDRVERFRARYQRSYPDGFSS